MNDLQVFSSKEFGEVRTVVTGGEILFVLRDVCEALGIQNATDVAGRLDSDEVTRFNLGGQSGIVNAVGESGLYSVILRSDKPNAKKFRRWVTGEVLPSIRKHGMYATDELLDNPDLLIKVATALKEERERNRLLTMENKAKTQIIGELKPKADYTDTILKNKGLVTTTQIAKDYGMSAKEMNDKLHKLDIQYKQSEQWLLYSKYHNLGYTHSETVNITRKDGRPDIKMNTKWTQKGRLFIYETLKKEGITPVIERED